MVDVILDKPEQIFLARLYTLRMGIEIELKGLRLTRGKSAYSIVKSEYGLTGSKQNVLNQFNKIIADYEMQVLGHTVERKSRLTNA
jgi:hypothetical protein